MYGDIDYSDLKVQEDIEQMTRDIEANQYVAGDLFTDSWLRGFLSFYNINQEYLPINISTYDQFVKSVREVC